MIAGGAVLLGLGRRLGGRWRVDAAAGACPDRLLGRCGAGMASRCGAGSMLWAVFRDLSRSAISWAASRGLRLRGVRPSGRT